MPKRVDVNGDGSEDELEEALRQLQGVRKAPPGESQPTQEVEEAVRELAEQQRAAAAARPRPARLWLVWVVLGVVLAAVAVLGIIFNRPEPLPPPATSPQGAVSGFWGALISHKYEAATVYYPTMVEKYGSRKQAAERLKEHFGGNPPVRLSRVGEPEEVPDSTDLRVTYEVYLRSGTPRSGDAIVSGDPQSNYVIVAGI